MWVESIHPENGIVNLDNVAQVKKYGMMKVYIQFKKSFESSIFWEYPTEEERNREYEFIKEITSPYRLGKYKGE